MKRLLLLALPLVLLAGCATEGSPTRPAAASDVAPPTSGRASAGNEASEPEASDSDPDPGPAPVLTVEGGRVTSLATFVVNGKVENTHVPARFALSTENGCARDVKLRTMTTGIGYAVTLDADELSDAFGCAVQAWAGDDLLGPITVTPDAEWSAGGALRLLDPPGVVSADVDRASGDMVRFIVVAKDAIGDASVELGGATFRATLAPYADDTADEGATDDARPTTAIFEVPSRDWATAVLLGAHAAVDVKLTSGRHETLDVRPVAKADVLAMDEGCGG